MGEKAFETAEWIFARCPEGEVCDRYFEYQTHFEAAAGSPTRLYISSYSQYAVSVNGRFVNCGQYDGYEDYQVYDTLDITEYLQNGDNVLTIGHYVCGADFFTRRRQIPGIIFAVWSGVKNLLSSNCSCLSRVNMHFLKNQEKITEQLGYNFEYDAAAPEAGFQLSVAAGKEKRLFPRPVKKLEITHLQIAAPAEQGWFQETAGTQTKARRMQSAVLIKQRSSSEQVSWDMPEEVQADGAYTILDMGKEHTGFLEFSLDVPEETEVLIGFGEHLEASRVPAYLDGRNFCFRYIAHKGHNDFFYPYQRIGLRYLQFHVYSRTGALTAGIRDQMYPVQELELPLSGELSCRIYKVGCRTLKLCMHEHYEDCPWREQALWILDSRIQALCGYYAFREYEFPRAGLRLMLRSLRPDGLLEACAPGKEAINIPSFTAVYVREILEYIEYAGDFDFAEEVFDGLQKIAEGFAERIGKNHLIPLYSGAEYWNFYEWRPGLDGTVFPKEEVYDAPLNAFVSDAFYCFSLLCTFLSKTELAETYRGYREAMNRAIHRMFYDEKAGAYRTSLSDNEPKHALTQALVLYAGAVPEELEEKVIEKMMDKTLVPSSLSMTIYVYEVLLKHPEIYGTYVKSEIERIWGAMLSAGADTFWETEKGAADFGGAGSLCHGWSAVPVYLFGKYRL